MKGIRDAVSSVLTNELKVRTPAVADSLSQVFAALTRHPHFDRLTFNEAKLPVLEMRVSSSGSPGTTHPTGVLNGQAQSALDLVPYFALGGGKETPTEVYLVLLRVGARRWWLWTSRRILCARDFEERDAAI